MPSVTADQAIEMRVNKMTMHGGGYYNENSNLQQMAVDKSFDVFNHVPFEGRSGRYGRGIPIGETITLADYGCSEGRNSVKLIENYLSRMSGISTATLIFNDTLLNDFSSLSSTIDANWSRLSQGDKVRIYPLLVPRSFYQQVLPDESVHAGFCFTALHWLQNVPPAPDPSLLSAYGHDDLVDFLSARHKELRHGGYLMLCIPVDGPISTRSTNRCFEDAVRTLAKTYPVNPSAITNLPVHWRTMDEILASVAASKGTWRVVQSTEIPMAHPATSLLDIISGEDEKEAEMAKNKYAETITGFTLAALSGFVLDDFRSQRQMESLNGARADRGSEDEKLLQELNVEFRRQFLRSYCREVVGFTYAFVKLEKH